MRKSFIVAFVLLRMGGFATVAISAEDLAAAVKERRHLMKEVVAPAAKLGGQMVKGVKPFDAAAAFEGNERDQRRAGQICETVPQGHGTWRDRRQRGQSKDLGRLQRL